VFCALNRTLRRRRRRLVTLAVILGLAGVVVAAHSAMHHDSMGDAMVMCLAVAETAIVGVGVAVALGARVQALRWEMREAPLCAVAPMPAPTGIRPRAGPSALQIFRL
jgi:drug/metabolite transporter (DMT)-like permease